MAGSVNENARAGFGGPVHGQLTLMGVHDRAADRQPHAQALRLRADERLENLVDRGPRHARTAVGHGDAHPATTVGRGRHRQAPGCLPASAPSRRRRSTRDSARTSCSCPASAGDGREDGRPKRFVRETPRAMDVAVDQVLAPVTTSLMSTGLSSKRGQRSTATRSGATIAAARRLSSAIASRMSLESPACPEGRAGGTAGRRAAFARMAASGWFNSCDSALDSSPATETAPQVREVALLLLQPLLGGFPLGDVHLDPRRGASAAPARRRPSGAPRVNPADAAIRKHHAELDVNRPAVHALLHDGGDGAVDDRGESGGWNVSMPTGRVERDLVHAPRPLRPGQACSLARSQSHRPS